MVGVGRKTHTRHLGINPGSTCQRVLQFLQHQRAGAFAQHETIAVLVERTRGRLRVVVTRRKGSHVAETTDAHLGDSTLAAAGNHGIGLAQTDQVEGVADGGCRRGAGGHRAVVRPAQAVPDGDLSGTDICDNLGYPVGAEPRRAVVGGIFDDFVLQAGHSAHAGTPHHAEARLVDVLVRQAGIAQGLIDDHQAIYGITVKKTHLLAVEML